MPDRSDLTAVYRETVHSLYRYVSKCTGGRRDLSEDIVQETFLRAFEYWEKHNVEKPLAWLRRVAHNLLVSHYRKKKPGALPDNNWDPASGAMPADSKVDAEWIQWGLAQLKGNHAQVLELFYFGELNTNEISRELGISERAVEGRLHRARLQLKKVLTSGHRKKGGFF